MPSLLFFSFFHLFCRIFVCVDSQAHVYNDRCFSFVGKEGRELNCEAESAEQQAAWISSISLIMPTQFVEDEDDSGSFSPVQSNSKPPPSPRSRKFSTVSTAQRSPHKRMHSVSVRVLDSYFVCLFFFLFFVSLSLRFILQPHSHQ